MTNEEVVRAYLDALNREDFAVAKSLYADDFSVVSSSTGAVLDADAYIEAHVAVAVSFPDLQRHVISVEGDGDTVTTWETVTATHDHEVRLPMLGITSLAPTGRKLETPPHRDTFTLRDGRITSVQSHLTPGTGLPGLIEQITATENG